MDKRNVFIDLSQLEGLKRRGVDDASKPLPRPPAYVPADDEAQAVPIDAEAVDSAKVKAFFTPFTPEVISAYGTLQSFMKELGINVDAPQFVLVGMKGCGKTTILESLLGHPILKTADKPYCPTNRPIIINVVYNPERHEPLITIKKDTFLSEFDKAVQVSVSRLPAELQARNSVTDVPIHLTYETDALMNVTFVDTPGLLGAAEAEADAEAAERVDAAVAALATSGDARSTVALCVERAGAWPSWLCACWAKQHKLSHQVGVFTGAYGKFSSFSGASSMAKYIIDKPNQNANNFFVEVPPACSLVCESGGDSAAHMREHVLKYDAAFKKKTATVDKRFEAFLSFEKLYAFVFDICLRGYRQLCPLVRQRYRDLLTAVEKDLTETAARSSSLTPWSLRSFAMSTFSCYAQLMQSLLDGTADSLSAGHVLTLGQTLAEETRASHGGPWPQPSSTSSVTSSTVTAGGDELEGARRPLLGRQQFERLLGEFRNVVTNERMETLSRDEIVSSYGTHKAASAEVVKMNWVCCDLARLRLEAQVKPLVDQLVRRVKYLLCRLSDTAFAVAAFPKFRAAQGPNVSFEYPFFNAWMKDLYGKIVEESVRAFREGCMEEFYPTETMVWEMSGAQEEEDSPRLPKDSVAAVRVMADKIFEDSKKRIARNILRSCFFRFLDKGQMWTEMQTEVNSSLSEDILPELFETDATKDMLEATKEILTKKRQDLAKKEGDLTKAISAIEENRKK